MKKILFLALLQLLTLQVEAIDKKTFTIAGTTSDKFNGKEVTLSVIQNDSLLPLSVDTIQNATFSFKGNMYLEQVAIVRLNDPEHDYSAEVFLEAGNIQVSLDSINHVKGTFLNDLYATYLSESQKRIAIAEKEYQANIEGKEDPQTERFDSLQKEYFMETESCYRVEGSQANEYFEFENDSLKVELLLSDYHAPFWEFGHIKEKGNMHSIL